ncbi:ArsA family ATPase [Rhodococcus sp. WB9]|uniref:ArsA family ATPase n=1 Tax=Rhodococcus sp. WB9 TaxID=2594007 RepID=UPI0011851F3A|nr:ArsA family ATPase [Rhodococcus sp. WB9]QDQ93432.1 ArsA family ATPase [Rhodococcus sp. WB9]
MSSEGRAGPARVQFFVGKGGVGKTTLAAATAQAAAEAGNRTLLVSLDQAHSLADVIGIAAARDLLSVTDTLDVLELDTLTLLENRFRSLAAVLAAAGSHDHGAQLSALEPEELTGLPGVQDVLGLREIVRFATEGDYDAVVVDCPPTADCLRTLAAPAMALEYIERVWPQHRRIVALLGSDSRLVMLVTLIEQVVAAVGEVREMLANRAKTTVRLVTTPERVVLTETRRTVAVAALSGLRIDAILVNNLLPHFDSPAGHDDPGVAWLIRRRALQQRVLAELTASAGATVILSVTRSVTEPVGWADLGGIARELYADDTDAVAVLGKNPPAVRVGLESGAGVDSVYTMRMYLPLVNPSTLTLGRVEDDLVVGAEGVRRRVRLASVLRRCVVAGAELDGSDLVVRFTPDPQVWPV